MAKNKRNLEIWKQFEEEVGKIVDGLGKGVDPKIWSVVVGLRAHGFPTDGSCQGHKNWGRQYPRVSICVDPPRGWKHSQRKQALWRRDNLKAEHALLALLEKFYRWRRSAFPYLLHPVRCGIFGAFEVCPMTAHASRSAQNRRRQRCQVEFDCFARFLKREFLASP